MLLTPSHLSTIGASLYICEGTKQRITNRGSIIYAVEFTNKDPRVIKLFLRFLREIIKAEEPRIKAELFIYPDHNKNELLQFWSDITQIPINRFHKCILLKQKNSRYKPNPLGTLKIRYFHKEHFLKIQDIIDRAFGKPAEIE